MKFKKISFHFQFYAIDRDILFNSNLSPSSPLLSSPPPSESHSPFIDRYNNRDEKFHGTATNCELQTLRITEFNEIRPKAHPMEYFYLYIYIFFFLRSYTSEFRVGQQKRKTLVATRARSLARVRACWSLAARETLHRFGVRESALYLVKWSECTFTRHRVSQRFHSRKPPLVLLDPSNSLENVRHFDYDSSSLKPRRLTVSLRNQRKGEEKESDRGRKVRKWRKVRERNRILHTKLLIRCCTFFIFFFYFFPKFLNNVKYLRFNYTMASRVFSLMS